MTKNWKTADRLQQLPPYLFAEIDNMKHKELEKGREIIDLGVGDPDQPTPKFILETMGRMLEISKFHRYPSYIGSSEFRLAVTRWFFNRFNVSLCPATEVISLIGSKEGIGHFPLAFINPGDKVLIPDPGYPVYFSGTVFAGGKPERFPLLEQNQFLPDLKKLKTKLKKTKLIFINYPNNPTSAQANDEFQKELIDLAHKNDFIIAQDAAYSEIYFDDDSKPKSILEFDGAIDVAVEFHSLSKTFNMTGWRVGFAAGNKDLISGLGQVKKNVDSGVFGAIQSAAITALDNGSFSSDEIRNLYKARREILLPALEEQGLEVYPSNTTFYLWIKCPDKFDSMKMTKHLLKEAGIISTPGVGFGEAGEGYIRLSLTSPTEDIRRAADLIKEKL